MDFIILLMFLCVASVSAQNSDEVSAISALLSVDPEDLSEEEMEKYSGLLKHRVMLNVASEKELSSTGLFTKFQIASLLDYRLRSGPCMSYMELASLDGFGADYVDRVTPFISLTTRPDVGGRTFHEVTARASLRADAERLRYGYSTRYKLKVGNRMNASFACTRSLDADSPLPDALCGSIEGRFKKLPLTFVVGDLNARFGQGLVMWTGSDFNSLNAPSAFMKRAFGVTPSASYSGNNVPTGFSSELALRRMTVTAFVTAPGIKSITETPEKLKLAPGINLTWVFRNGQVGMTHYQEFADMKSNLCIPVMRTSADVSMCIGGVDVFSEFMYDWVEQRLSGTAGVITPVGQYLTMAARLKYADLEYSMAVAAAIKKRKLNCSLSSELVMYSESKAKNQDRSIQLKMNALCQLNCFDFLELKFRMTERVRSWGHRFRTDARLDLTCPLSQFVLTGRVNMLNCDGTSFLTYIEGGYKTGGWAVYLRQGLFVVDDWDDRIYVYERDAPGCYNVPAFYGRGLWTSFMCSYKLSHLCRLYFRAGYTTYPLMTEKKPGKAELRFQSVFDF